MESAVDWTLPLDTLLGSMFLSAAMSDWSDPMLVHKSASATVCDRPSSPSTMAITTPAATSAMIHVFISPPRFALGGSGQPAGDERGEEDRGDRVPRRLGQDQQALEQEHDGPHVGDRATEAAVGEQRDPREQREYGDHEVPEAPDPEVVAVERVGEVADLIAAGKEVQRGDDPCERHGKHDHNREGHPPGARPALRLC